MDSLLIAVAFVFGLIAQQFRLPPMVGFLIAGFVLQAMGQKGGEGLEVIANLGVTLLLFSIGLKLQVKSLGRPEIWAGTSLHATLVLLLFAPVILGIAALATPDLGMEWQTALLLAFALSFSSTVFAIKSLVENGDLGALHGKAAVGILVMQDIIAVLFLTVSTGKFPSTWSLILVPALIIGRPVLGWIMNRAGHGELLSLCGLMLALVIGAKGFDLVGLKADLGALFIGVMVGWHPRASELKKSLNHVTDLLLVGFFLQVGLEGALTWQALGWGLMALVLLPLKSIGFFFLLTRFHMRARTAWMTSFSLSTYSEFGLIVASLGVAKGWMGTEWLIAVALALSLSFLIAAPLNRRAESLYDPISDWLKRFERPGEHEGDFAAIKGRERVAIFGMGRVGLAAYHTLEHRFPGHIIGFDRSPEKIAIHQEAERNVRLADATDSDFWERVCPNDDLDMVVLAMPSHKAHLHAIETLKRHHYSGVVIVSGKQDYEVQELRDTGVDAAFNLYAQAGVNFANHIYNVFLQQRPDLVASWRAANEVRDS
ncbi:cation:proton antiporter [Verrucomicrobiaceae bacterium R5-34]|nr:cation:proton antiporter [Verrucomicrobiaceae bacterium R5-34]